MKKVRLQVAAVLFMVACVSHILVTPPALCHSTAKVAAEIAAMEPRTWYEIPNTRLGDVVAYKWPNGKMPGMGFRYIIESWSGGAFDSTANRLLIWGGGHNGYGGNEIYAFDFDTYQWERLTTPSTYAVTMDWYHGNFNEDGLYADGKPVSRHTYNHILYHPGWNALVAVGTRADFSPNANHANKRLDYYDLDSGSWLSKADAPNKAHRCVAVDTTNDHIWTLELGNQRKLWEYDPSTDAWIQRSPRLNFGWDYYTVMEIDPIRKKLVIVGYGKYLVFDISAYDYNGYITQVTNCSSGPQAVVNSPTPTIAYDTKSKLLVSWLCGTDVYVLNLDTHRWTRVQASTKNTITPTKSARAGTFGRWRYVPDQNVFVIVNAVDENVFVYRLTKNRLQGVAGIELTPD